MWTSDTRRQHSRAGLRYASDLTDAEWAVLALLLPPAPRRGRRRAWPEREIVNAIFYFLRAGCAWRLLPDSFPPWRTVYRWFARLRDGGVLAACLYRQLATQYLAPPNQRVWPRNRLPIEALARRAAADGLVTDIEVPALLRGYLKAGARILGEPHVDPQFGCADFPIMLEVSALAPRLTARLTQQA